MNSQDLEICVMENLIMEKIMKKKYLVVTVVVFLLSMIYVGCSNSFDIGEENQEIAFNNPYSNIGLMHNEGLEYVIDSMQKTDFNEIRNLSKNQVFELCSKHYIKFCEDNIECYSSLPSEDFFHHTNLIATLSPDRRSCLDSLIVNSDLLTDKQKQHLLTISEINDKNLTLVEYKVDINIINQLIDNDLELTEEEKIILFIATSIAESSREYWDGNFDEWLLYFSDLYGIDTSDIDIDIDILENRDWVGLLKYDIIGGIIGGCAGATAGGVGAGPGALSGALLGSMAYSLDLIWDYFF